MEDADEEINSRGSSFAPPTWISFSSFPPQASPSPRRISSNFTPPTRPVRAAKQLAWVCGAEEASSAKSIGGGLNSEEAAAWELFSPIHRVLIVAVIAVAAANSKKNKQIIQLKKSVEIRANSSAKAVDDEAMIKCRIPVENDTEPEECRMSDLSDWAPSVSSTVDGQWSTTSIELDLCKELKDKDAIVNELLAFLNTTESNGSKRISELEDIIQHKNMIITKLRKDSLVLEQKVMHLTRLRRASTSKSSLRSRKLPTMTDNLVYDMDSTTSPSSDSDSSTKKHQVSRLKNEDQVLSVKTNNDQSNTSSSRGKQKTRQPNCAELMVKSTKKPPRPISPLKDKPMNQQAHSLNVSRDFKSRSGTTKTRVSSSHIRWV
ncbi:hypothetical protein Ccrd_021524 [Cynara cardunculus var. scolymus]|uniref:Uncharacterized protein n=1 Tax=Cynara cardunculus var. scolymus TaxID=59895 RepID=A0A118JZP9_CYNCS|nr:hypothetical protein Ccrd_021524 [Cynara cardunculus var. scolymus]